MSDVREKTLIIKDTSLKRGFTSIPNIVLTSSLSFGAKTIYSLLLMFAWQEKETFPGQARLAQDAGCTERTVRTYLNELKKAGLITWKQRGLTKTNIYYINSLDSFSDRKDTSGQDRKQPNRKNTSGSDRKDTSGQDRKLASDKEYTDQEYTDQEYSDQVTNDSLRSSLVTHGLVTHGSAVNQNPILEIRNTALDGGHDSANAISKRPPVEKEADHDLGQLSIKTGDNNKVTEKDKPDMDQEKLLTESGIQKKPLVEKGPILKQEQLLIDTGVNKKSMVEGKPNISQGNLSLEKGVNSTPPLKKEPEHNKGQVSTRTGEKKETNLDQEAGYTGITNADLITVLGDSLRGVWDGPPAKAYGIAGRMYYLYDFPAAEASINIFRRRVEAGYKFKNPVAYLMKVAREKKKEFESVSYELQIEEDYEYFAEKYPEEHLKRVEEAKRVSAEHEQYLQDMRMFHDDGSLPSVSGFSTPFEIIFEEDANDSSFTG